jgi:MFS family permease
VAVSALRAALRNAQLRRVQLAWGATVLAEWMHFVALGVFAYSAGGTVAVGIAGAARMLPAALLAPFAAVLGDRFRRERVLAATAALGGLALAGSAAAASEGSELAVYVLAGVVGIALTVIRPTQQALLPSLARTPDELVAANGTTSTVESVATLAGPLVAGLLIAQTSVAAAFAVGGAALLLAAFSFARVEVEGRLELASEQAVARWHDLVAGVRIVARAPRPRLVVGLFVAQGFVRGCLNVLIVVTAFEIIDAGAAGVGYMTAALGVGGLVGALGAYTLAGRGLAIPFAVSLVFWGVPIALLAPLSYTAAAVVLLAVVGIANSIEDVAGFTLVQRIVRDQVLSRVLGTLWGLAMGAVALGSLAAPVIVDLAGARWALVVVGAVLPLLIVVTWRQLAAIDRDVAAPAAALAHIDEVPMFAPLSLAAKEEIASRLVAVTARRGDVVIRAGDRGDRFYIVAGGELRVDADGAASTMRAGDSFGEIALLRDVPRTATVEALVDSELYALGRDDFLAAVTGHREARAAGDAVATARLAESGE